MPTVRIDAEVFEALKKLAEPLVDTPNSVVRRLLEEKALLAQKPSAARAVPAKTELAPTPQTVYEELLLKILDEQFAGRADKRSITLAIVEKMQKYKLIRAADLELVATGETRAENAIAWGRHALKERGLLLRHSPRGIWELSDEGRVAARAARKAG